MTESRSRLNLLSGPEGKTLVRLALPMLLGITAIILFNVVDTYFVGQLGPLPLAAMGFTFPVVFVVISISMGLGIGATSVISRAIGEGDHQRVRRVTTDSLALALVLVLCAAGFGLLTMDPVFSAMGAPRDLLPLIRDYMTPWYLGVGLLVIPMVGNSAIRATGDTRTPSVVMIVAGLVNAVLDPLLIFGLGPFPRLELTGAALSTVLSYAVAFVAALWLLRRREMLDLRHPGLRTALASWGAILHVGLPAAATNLLVPLCAAVLTRMVSGHGPDAVAAFGVAGRLESLAMIGIGALATALTPFVGQNFGAGNHQRVRRGVRQASLMALVWSGAATLLLMLLARPVAGLFSEDPAVVLAVVEYLWVVPLSYGLYGVAQLVNATFNAVNRPLSSAALIVLRLFVLAVPLAYLGSRWWGLVGIFYGMGLANVVVGLAATVAVQRFIARCDAALPAEVQPVGL